MAAFLFVLWTAGCAGVEPATHSEPPQAGATLDVAHALPGEPPQTRAADGGAAAVEPGTRPATPQPTHPAVQSVAKTDPTGAKTPAKRPASTAPIEQLSKKENAPPTVPTVAKPQAPPPLDLASLENRLKETKAIGLLTKLALKNQVDDLLNQFRAYYQGSVKTTLAQLRQRYDLLLLKVLSLLQDSDQSLATAIGASREAIWGILADQQKFATI